MHTPVLHGAPRYFGNVCELDLIFNFHKAYYILDELLIAGKCRMCLWSSGAELQQCTSTSWLRTHPFALSHGHLLAHCSTRTHMHCLSLLLSPVRCGTTGKRGIALPDISLTSLCLMPRTYPTGELQEPSKRVVSKAIEAQDILVENAKNGLDESGQPMR